MEEGSKIYQLDPVTNPTKHYVFPVSHPDGLGETEKMSIEQVANILAETLGTGGGNAPVFIPVPKVEVRAPVTEGIRTNEILLSWDDCQDKRFLNYQPKFLLYRYKEAMKSVKRDPITLATNKRRIPSGFKHPNDGTIDIHNPTRPTEWTVPNLPNIRLSIAFDHSQWFRLYTDEWNQTLNQTFQPKGLRHSKINIAPDTRRNMFVKFKIQITIENKVYESDFSQELKIGYTRSRASLGQDRLWDGSVYNDNYLPMIQLV